MGHHCDWCGNARTECECEDRHMAGLSYQERALRTLVSSLEARDERVLPRIETVRFTGAGRSW